MYKFHKSESESGSGYLIRSEYYSYLDLNKKPFIFKVKGYTGIGYTLYDISEYPKLFEHYTIRTSLLWHSELFTLISHDIHNFTHLERLALIDKLYK